jgi:YggT family protein
MAGPCGAPLLFDPLLFIRAKRDAAEVSRYAIRRKVKHTPLAALRGHGHSVNISSSLLTHWYFHLPNFILAALMYTLLGRALLALIVQPDSSNYIWRFFCRITDPVVAAVALVTPKAAAPVVIWLFGVVWLFWLRVGFLFALLFFGLSPRLT